MLFNSLHFYVFILIVIPVFFYLEKKGQKRFLLWASVYFYSCLKLAFLPILLLSFIATFYTSIFIEEAKSIRAKKLWLFLCLVVNLGILGFFKYTDFLRSISHDVSALFGLGTSGFEPIGLILPLGISFYTFQAIAYAIDVYREEIPAEKKFSDFSLFLLFFPQLVAGPIMRASVLIPQFHERKIFSKENLISGLPVVALGIFKKTMIADPIALAISPVYENPAAYDFIAIITATYLFSIQIYCDFAGYSDIAIGIGKIMGFDIPVNFHRPFLSQSITELWKRWHISLSSWLRDYVYIPLGGSKVSKLHNYINVFLTMVIGGIWHGAAWTFVIWGTINGLVLIIEKFFIEKKWDRFFAKIPAPIKIVYTFSIFTVGALFFRSETVEKAFLSAGKIFHGASGMSLIPGIEVVIPLLILVLIESSEEAGKDFAPLFNRVPIIKYGLIGSILLIAGMIYTVTVSPQFYYFQF